MLSEISKTKNTQPIEFLWLGLYAFAGFSIELILSFIVNLLGFDSLSKGINSILTGILWFSISILLIKYSKSRFDYDVLAIKKKLTVQKFLLIQILIVIITIATFVGFDGFKPFVEFKSGSKGNIITYLLQIFYYLGESTLIVLCIAFGQCFCEKQLSLNKYIPSGGLFLALTWGGIHILLQGVSGGLFTMFFAILAGIIYLICEKDFRWSYLFIAIAFIL